MRIGIDVRCLAEGRRTGVEEYTLALLQALFVHDQENEYILFFNAWQRTLPDFSWIESYTNVSLRVFRLPNKVLNVLLWYLRFPKIDHLIGGVDVFFLPNLNFISVSPRTKLVVTAHDLSFELFPETFSWKQRLWHALVHFPGLVKRADKVIAVSQSTREDLLDYYHLPEEKIATILSGIDPRFHHMDRNDPGLLRVKERYHLPYKFILSLGTFEPRKNALSLVHAFEALQRLGGEAVTKYELVLAGTPGWKSDAVYEAVATSPYRDRIHLPGFIADSDKVALYNLASVFVYSSFYEGFGFPPLEALACGTPVITSHSSALPEVMGGAALLIDPYQPEELLQALRSLLANQELLTDLRERGLKQAATFSWERTARETLEVFRTLVSRKK